MSVCLMCLSVSPVKRKWLEQVELSTGAVLAPSPWQRRVIMGGEMSPKRGKCPRKSRLFKYAVFSIKK